MAWVFAVWLLRIVALPLFRSFADVFPSAQPLLLSADANHAYWKAQQ